MFNFFRVLVLVCCVGFFGQIALGQYEGQVVVTYDGPSEFAPSYQQQVMQASQPVYASGGSTGGSGGATMYRMYSAAGGGGSTGGYAGAAGGSTGGYASAYQSAPVYYQAAPVQYYQQPVQYYQAAPSYGGRGGGFGIGFGANWGSAYQPRRMVCGPNGCHYQ